jgi:HEAT repeat protein
MVGGVSLMPSVQKLLKEYFSNMVVRTDKPFTAVAEGALQVAAGGGVEDVLTHSYGLRYLDPATGLHHYDEIIPMGTPYPTGKPVEVILTVSQPDQTDIELIVGQIDTLVTGNLEVAYEKGQAVFVAQPVRSELEVTPLKAGIVALNPPGRPGEERLRVGFSVNAQRHLVVTVTDLKTGQQILNTVVETDSATEPAPTNPTINGREPALATQRQKRGWRLAGKGLATMFDVLPPEAISLNAVTAALQHPDITVRYNAATFLRRRGDREARLVMQNALQHPEARVRASVARQLQGFSWFAAEPLIQQALQDSDLRVREAAIYALCDRDETQAYQLMAELLQNEKNFVRAAAAFGLRECTDPQAVPVLEAVMMADDPEVRVKALDTLSVNRTDQAASVVRRALFDSAPYVQYTATMSLLELRRADCLPELADLIKQVNGESREHILRGFFQASNHLSINVVHSQYIEQIFEALEISLQDNYAPARMAAIWPLAWLDHDRARSLLRYAYKQEQDDRVKAHIIYVAVNILSPLGKEFLEEGRQSKNEIIREKAQEIQADIESGAIRVEWQYT